MQRTRRFQTLEEPRDGYLAQDGVVVYVLHPDAPDHILTIPHPDVGGATATCARIASEYFSPALGFKMIYDMAVFDGTDGWISPQRLADKHWAGVANRRMAGYELAGETLVISLKRMARRSDLDIVFERASTFSALHVLLDQDDSDGVGRTALFERLAKVASQLVELTLEAPFDRRSGVIDMSLEMPAEFLASMPHLERFAALGVIRWPRAPLPASLAHVRLADHQSSTPHLKRLLQHSALRTLAIFTTYQHSLFEYLATADLGHLAELTLEGLPNVTTVVEAFASSPRRPSLVRLRGRRHEPSDPGIVSAAAQAGIIVDGYPSPFDPVNRPATLRAMWEGLD